MNKTFTLDLNLIQTAKDFMAAVGQFSLLSNSLECDKFDLSLVDPQRIKQYDMNNFHYGRFDDYIEEIINREKYKFQIPSLAFKKNPEEVTFIILNAKLLEKIFDSQENNGILEIFKKYNVTVMLK